MFVPPNLETSMMTATGDMFDYSQADEPDNLPDIAAFAHQLALTNRFCGATVVPYSVAEHCWRVSMLCEQHGIDPLWGLMHDAAEALLSDISRPAKSLLPDYKGLEGRILRAVASKYGLAPEIPEGVHWADLVLLVTEGRDLCPEGWPVERLCKKFGVQPLDRLIEPLEWRVAQCLFHSRFNELGGIEQRVRLDIRGCA